MFSYLSTEFHSWLLSEDVNLLSRLLLPIAGPEEFEEEDMDCLPLDLQYLPSDKKREEDAEVRLMLVQAVHKVSGIPHCYLFALFISLFVSGYWHTATVILVRWG